MNPENQSQSEQFEAREKELSYESIRKELEGFLPFVGEQIMELRRSAEADSNFTRLKANKTIVTKADELSEDLIRAWIEERFPDDTIRGEEKEKKHGGARNWIVDPIDGTYNFSNFGNKFGISVGLIEDNTPKLGVIFYPSEGICISASEGAGAFINGVAIKTSEGVTKLIEAHIIAQLPSNLDDIRFKETGNQQSSLLSQISSEGMDWSYTASFLKFLQGDTDAILHFYATPYDIAGACAIAKELKLEVSGYDGKPLDFSKDIISIIVSKNLQLHEAIVKCLNQPEFQETGEFKNKKRQFFTRLGMEMREVLKQHKIHGLWERDERRESWRNVSEHCLVEAARAEAFGEKLKLSDKVKRDLQLAAALHDFYKKNEVEAIKVASKSEGLIWPALEGQAKKELKAMRDEGINEDIIYIKEGVGAEKWSQLLMLEILDKQKPLSDADVACLLLHYIDDYTRGSDWVESAEIIAGRGKINELDRRVDKNESNPNYKKLDEEGKGWFKEGETGFQAQRRIGHLVEGKIAELLKEKAGINIDPLDLPEFIDNEIRGKIESI